MAGKRARKSKLAEEIEQLNQRRQFWHFARQVEIAAMLQDEHEPDVSRQPLDLHRKAIEEGPSAAREYSRQGDTLRRVRVRPFGRTLNHLRQNPADDLQDLYDPDAVARSFYRPAEPYGNLSFVPVRTGAEWHDPPGHHRLQIPCMEHKRGQWQLRMNERKIRTAKQLQDFSETEEFRRARFLEATGDWPKRLSTADYRRYVERKDGEVMEGLRQLAESERKLREGATNSFDFDTSSSGQSVTRNIDTEFIPLSGGTYNRQLYLYAHWEQTSKAFEMKNHSELAKAAVNITSDFALGRGVSWKIENDDVEKIWQEFWTRNKMEERIRTLSDDLCLAGPTRIACLDGTNPTIAELAERNASEENPIWVYSYDHATGRVAPGKAVRCWKQPKPKRCVTVTLDNGETVVASHDHPFLMRDGRYVWAEELRPGDSLMPLYRKIKNGKYERVWHPDIRRIAGIKAASQLRRAANNHKVVSVEPAGEQPVYDLSVEKHHNFALTAGVFTHNTWQGELLVRKFESLKGRLAIRSLDPGNFYEIVTDPADVETVFYYWQQNPAPYQQLMGNYQFKNQIPSTKYIITQYPPTEIYHIKNNVSSSEKWGRSDFFSAFGTLKRHRDWTNAVTLKDMLQANLIWKIKVKGDQGDVDAFVSDNANMQLPGPGGTWLENEALELSALHENTVVGRGEGSTGQFLTALFATAVNMPLTYFNVAAGGTARATALTQGEPFVKKIATRQQVLRDLLDHLFEEEMKCAVKAGRIEPSVLRHEDADPEWIFPSVYEEDRGAKFRDLKAARESSTISHRTLATQQAQELGLAEYSYQEELNQIAEEMRQGFLGRWPEGTEVAAQLSAGQQPSGAPGQPGDPNSIEDAEGRNEKLAGADERAKFKKEWRDHSTESDVSAADRKYLEAALPTMKPGESILLPSGRVARRKHVESVPAGNA